MITIKTDRPVAADSLDHIHPHGTGWDNSVLPSFNAKVFARWPNLKLLDIGCAGGGLVKSILDDGGLAVGVEGSDFSKQTNRAEWATIPDNLFTADATVPFHLFDEGVPLQFDVVTSWEMLEHIAADDLPSVFENVANHMTPDGVFIASINSLTGVSHAGIEYHVTIESSDWWIDTLSDWGFELDQKLTDYIDPDWVRGLITGVEGSLCAVFRSLR